ncbi:MAG: binding-protein-dependent transport system inner rane component, partial [Geminicoccaceae bacterium]|nr:binding-protein-dependent transport system inner rane component [Geminicoccaceae bacterium]
MTGWPAVEVPRERAPAADFLRRHPTVVAGLAILALMTLLGVLAPWLGTVNPLSLDPVQRLKAPTEAHWFGTDSFGRDIYSRTVYGSRISLIVGISVAVLSTLLGLAIGLAAGYSRIVDALVMRVMDGMMAVPSILLAIALIALTKASVTNVILAITIPEVPRVVRLVRSVVLSIREQPYIEAAVAIGTSLPRIFSRHLLPNTLALRRRRHAARGAELGQHHGRGPGLLPDQPLHDPVPGPVPGAHRARGEPVGRRAPGPPRSAHREAHVTAGAGPPILEIEDLRTQFLTRDGVVKAVDGVSLELRRGETLGVVGES